MPKFDHLFLKISGIIGIDLGTSNTRIVLKGTNSIISNDSVVAINIVNSKLISVGKNAKRMIGKTPSNIKIIQPIKGGCVVDFESTQRLIENAIKLFYTKSKFYKRFLKPVVVISIPTIVTEVEINSIVEAAKAAGAQKVFAIESPLLSALGSNIENSSQGNIIVDIGAGTTDIVAFSMGGILNDKTLLSGGDQIDLSIVNYIKNKYNLDIGLMQAEELKINNLTLTSVNYSSEQITINGQDLISGLPKATKIYSMELSESVIPVLDNIATNIKSLLEELKPEFISDILKTGIIITGGGSAIKGIASFLKQRTGVNFIISQHGEFTVAMGLKKSIEDTSLIFKYRIKDLIIR